MRTLIIRLAQTTALAVYLMYIATCGDDSNVLNSETRLHRNSIVLDSDISDVINLTENVNEGVIDASVNALVFTPNLVLLEGYLKPIQLNAPSIVTQANKGTEVLEAFKFSLPEREGTNDASWIDKAVWEAALSYALCTGDVEITYVELEKYGFLPYDVGALVSDLESNVNYGGFSKIIPVASKDEIGSRDWLIRARSNINEIFLRDYYGSADPATVVPTDELVPNHIFWKDPESSKDLIDGSRFGDVYYLPIRPLLSDEVLLTFGEGVDEWFARGIVVTGLEDLRQVIRSPYAGNCKCDHDALASTELDSTPSRSSNLEKIDWRSISETEECCLVEYNYLWFEGGGGACYTARCVCTPGPPLGYWTCSFCWEYDCDFEDYIIRSITSVPCDSEVPEDDEENGIYYDLVPENTLITSRLVPESGCTVSNMDPMCTFPSCIVDVTPCFNTIAAVRNAILADPDAVVVQQQWTCDPS